MSVPNRRAPSTERSAVSTPRDFHSPSNSQVAPSGRDSTSRSPSGPASPVAPVAPSPSLPSPTPR